MRGRKLRGDVFVNLLFAVVKAAALMWLIRVAAANLAAVELGLFLFARRFSGTAANLLQCGASQTLLRYVALHADDGRVRRNYAIFALVGWCAIAAASVAACGLAGARLAAWLFPAEPASDLAFWTGMLLVAMVLDFLVRSVLIAERRLVAANMVELMTGSGFVLAALWMRLPTVAGLLRFQALTVTLLCAAVAVVVLRRMPSGEGPASSGWKAIGRTYAVYGLPRGLITFLDMGLLLVGPWLLRGDVVRAGYLLIALSVVQLFAAAMGPIAQVAMVVTAQFAGQNNTPAIREGVALLLGAILYTVLPLFAFLAPWGGPLTRLWLGDNALAAGVLAEVGILAWGILPFSLFQGLKGVVEAYWVRPYNLYSLAACYVVLILAQALLPAALRPGAVTALLVVGFWVAGVATLFWLRDFLPAARYVGWTRLAALVLVVGLASFALARAGALLALFPAALVCAAILAAFVRFAPTPFTAACQALVWPTGRAA